MPKSVPRLVSELPGLRSSLIEVVLLALAVSLGVNLIAGAISASLPVWAAVVIGLVIGLLPVLYVARSRLKPLEHHLNIRGFYVSEAKKPTIVEVPGYQLSEDTVGYLNSAFSENPALRRQWESEPNFQNWEFHKSDAPPPSARLLQELMEYILLDKLSLSLSEYFNHADFSQGRLAKYGRSDLPDILLNNRFLELFSRDPADRDGFDAMSTDDEDGVVVYAISSTGGLYSRFELTLPAESSIRRGHDQSLEISGPAMTILLSVDTRPFGADAPHSLLQLYVGRPFFECHALNVEFNVHVKLKRGLFMKHANLRYLAWIEKALQDLDEQLSGSAFVDRVRWDSIEALYRVFKEEHRRRPRTTEDSNLGDGSERGDS